MSEGLGLGLKLELEIGFGLRLRLSELKPSRCSHVRFVPILLRITGTNE